VFITDGQSDAKLALDAANADTGDGRLFTLGLGAQVNRPLLERLANLKRGRFTYVDRASQIESEVGKLAASIAKPLLVDVSVEVDGAQAVRLYPRSLGDLFAEDELLVTGRLRGTGTAKFTIKGRLGGKAVAFTRSVDLGKAPNRPWVGRLWAQARVQHLLEELSLGNQTGETKEMENEVIELALAYNFVTPYTAFLAIPESEMGNERATVERERERKRQIMANHQDAAELDKTKEELKPADTTQNRPGLGTSVGNYRAPTPSKPAPGQVATRESIDVDDEEPAQKSKRSYAAKSDEEDDYDGEDVETEGSPPDYAESAPVSTSGSVASRRGRGCAGCATNDRGSTALLALALAALVLRRRRRG
jgi:MYXO-CTERM domain-containing protein